MDAVLFIAITLPGPLFFGCALLLFAWDQAKMRMAVCKRILDETGETADIRALCAVKYDSRRSFGRISARMFDWEATGILFSEPNGLRFVGSNLLDHRPLVLEFQRESTAIEWVGRRWIPGPMSWFRLLQSDVPHYFSAETGVTVLGSKQKSRRLFNELRALGYPSA